MSEKSPFDSFIDLITFDQVLQKDELAIVHIEQEITQLKEQERQLESTLSAAKRDLHDIKKYVDTKELEMKELEAQEMDKKKRMDQVSTNKEYQSLKHELEAIAQQQLKLEDILISAWNERESVQKHYDEQVQDSVLKKQEIETAIEKKKADIHEFEVAVAEKKKIRVEKESRVPQEWFEKYMAMRSQVSDPVVPVIDGCCNSCFHQLTDQEIIWINRNKLLQCKGCYRFLYNELLKR